MVNTHLRATLRANGYTEADLARELGLTPRPCSGGSPRTAPRTGSTAVKVAKLLDVPLAWAMAGLDEDTGQRVPPGSRRVLPAPGRYPQAALA